VGAMVGRERELVLIQDVLSDIGAGARSIHLHGEAGIGKTTLWQHILESAAGMGFRVLATRPTEAEARLSFLGLTDLVGPLFDEIGHGLPPPQRSALGAALLRSSGQAGAPEPLAVSLGTLALLRSAADTAPTLVAVDDTPWLDDPSATALEFVARRLEAERIVILAAERTATDAEATGRLVSAMPHDRVTAIRLSALSMADVDRLLGLVLGLELPPSILTRLYRTSGGNAFYAVELGRALQRRGDVQPGTVLAIPDTLSDLLRDRLDALSPAGADVVEHAAALSQPTRKLLAGLLGDRVVDDGMNEAVAANVLAVEPDAIRFTHPLLAAELYAGLGDVQRRDLHRRLAGVVTEPEEHARHAALATEGPDETVAAELERASEHAAARGAPDSAADLVERALALTVDARQRVRRLQAAARHHLRAGDIARARICLEKAVGEAAPGNERASVLLQLGEVRALMDDWVAGERMFNEALAEVGDDAAMQVEIRLQLGGVSHITGHTWDAGAAHVFEAMRRAEALGDQALLARTFGPYLTWSHVTGAAIPIDAEDRAAALGPWAGHIRTMDRAEFDIAHIRYDEGDLQAFERLYQWLLQRAEQLGDYSSLPFLLANMTRMDFIRGTADLAAERLQRAERLARATGQKTALGAVLVAWTQLHARLGNAEEAWANGRRLLGLVTETGWIMGEPQARATLAVLELSRRSPDEALAIVQPYGVAPGTAGASWVLWQLPWHAEALIALGRIDEARAIVDGWFRNSPFGAYAMRMRHFTRLAALIEAADGHSDEADRLLHSAEEQFAAAGNRWSIARTALVAAEIHRRARRRAKARDALVAARDTFDALHARLWAAYARDQLDRVTGSRERAGDLTPTELQVAELAAQGLTNREVGDRLFMSHHTVEAHLTTVYRELGIRSRAELAATLIARIARGDGAASDPASVPPESPRHEAG
jgi:DNA-binding CsgD family transcriptional regulator